MIVRPAAAGLMVTLTCACIRARRMLAAPASYAATATAADPERSERQPGRHLRGAGRRHRLEDASSSSSTRRPRSASSPRETIQNSPATNIGDLLRAVPGVNVTQVSARDVNITTRGATSTLSTSQLALVDGRSVYLDFFGMVMWDLVPDQSRTRSGRSRSFAAPRRPSGAPTP